MAVDATTGDGGPRTPTNAVVAYDEIKRRILGNHYGPGTAVSVQDLSAELGMSRTPIRDALIRLEKERLVELMPRRGFRVLPIAPDDMLEIHQILTGLEAVAIELLIERGLGETEASLLLDRVAALETALESDDLDAWAEHDAAFHRTLIELARNRRLAAVIGQFMDQTMRVRAVTLRLRPKPARSTRNHRRLAEAIIRRDREAARAVHWDQRFRSARELSDILARLNLRHL